MERGRGEGSSRSKGTEAGQGVQCLGLAVMGKAGLVFIEQGAVSSKAPLTGLRLGPAAIQASC